MRVSGDRAARLGRVRDRMGGLGVDALLLSLGADLPWLSGYEAMPLERLTMLVVPADGPATLVVPRLEAPRVEADPDSFSIRPWAEDEDPVAIVAGLVGARTDLAVSDRTWATFVLALQQHLPSAVWRPSSEVTGPLRAVKDSGEIVALAAASAAADRVATQLLAGDIPLVGRSEREVSRDIGRRADRRGAPEGQLRHRGQRPQLRQPPPRTGLAGHRSPRGRGMRLRRHHGRVLLRHHPHRVDGTAQPGGGGDLPDSPEGPDRGGGGRLRRRVLCRGRRGDPLR